MTNEEKQKALAERNKAICDYYAEGHKLSETSRRFKMNRQRVLQILNTAGVWKPYKPSKEPRTFLGITVPEATKRSLTSEAKRKGISVSKLASDALDTFVAEEEALGEEAE